MKHKRMKIYVRPKIKPLMINIFPKRILRLVAKFGYMSCLKLFPRKLCSMRDGPFVVMEPYENRFFWISDLEIC